MKRYSFIMLFSILLSPFEIFAKENDTLPETITLTVLDSETSTLLDSLLKLQPSTYIVRNDKKTKEGILQEEKVFVITPESNDTLLTLDYQSRYKNDRIHYYYDQFLKKNNIWYLQKEKFTSLYRFPQKSSLCNLISFFTTREL